MVNYYSEFGLDVNSSSEQILEQLKQQKRKWVHRQDAADLEARQKAELKTKLIEEAYLIFTDDLKRKQYDLSLSKELKNKQQQSQQQQQVQQQTQATGAFTIEQAINEVNNLYDSGNSDALIQRCTKYIENGYHHPELYRKLGYGYWDNNQINMAVAAFKNGLNVCSSEFENYKTVLYIDLAKAYMSNNDYQNASSYIDIGLKLAPNDTILLTLNVKRLLLSGNITGAESLVNEHLTAYPSDEYYKEKISEVYLNFSDTFLTYLDNGADYCDNVNDYNSILYWRQKAKNMFSSERTTYWYNTWVKKGEKKFNKQNFAGIVVIFLVSLSFLGSSKFIFALLFAIGCVFIWFSLKSPWQLDKMSITGQNDTVSSICRIIYAIWLGFWRFVGLILDAVFSS